MVEYEFFTLGVAMLEYECGCGWKIMAVEQSLSLALSSFQWPWQYEFPPFFTLQTNLDTRNKQMDAWCDLTLAYYRHIKAFTMDVNESQSSPLFNNSKANRKRHWI